MSLNLFGYSNATHGTPSYHKPLDDFFERTLPTDAALESEEDLLSFGSGALNSSIKSGHTHYDRENGLLMWAWGQETAAYDLKTRKELSKPLFWRIKTKEAIGNQEARMLIDWAEDSAATGYQETQEAIGIMIQDYEAFVSNSRSHDGGWEWCNPKKEYWDTSSYRYNFGGPVNGRQ